MQIKEAIKIIKRLIESVELVYKSNPLTDKEPHPETEALTLAIAALEKQEIIRCKDCKNSEHWYRDRRRCFLWSEDGVSVFDDGFCNYAERRTECGADMRGEQDG